jgi:DNA-binding CsgD family transcriptional regulator
VHPRIGDQDSSSSSNLPKKRDAGISIVAHRRRLALPPFPPLVVRLHKAALRVLSLINTELTVLERDVLAGAALGESVAATALRISRAPATVKHHRTSLLRKLGARNVAHAIGLAYQRGVLRSEAPRESSDINERQISAFHAKLNILSQQRHLTKAELKEELLDRASTECGREIKGLHDLHYHEMSRVLDELQDAIVLTAVQ